MNLDINNNPIFRENSKNTIFDENITKNITLADVTNESCRLFGTLRVHASEGTIQIIPHFFTDTNYIEYNDEDATIPVAKNFDFSLDEINFSHRINHFHVGMPDVDIYPSNMDNHSEIQLKKGKLKMLYFVKIIPRGNDFRLFSYGMSCAQSFRRKESRKYPGIFIHYNMFPIGIEDVSRHNLIQGVTEIMSILGGLYAIITYSEAIYDRYVQYNSEEYLPFLKKY